MGQGLDGDDASFFALAAELIKLGDGPTVRVKRGAYEVTFGPRTPERTAVPVSKPLSGDERRRFEAAEDALERAREIGLDV